MNIGHVAYAAFAEQELLSGKNSDLRGCSESSDLCMKASGAVQNGRKNAQNRPQTGGILETEENLEAG